MSTARLSARRTLGSAVMPSSASRSRTGCSWRLDRLIGRRLVDVGRGQVGDEVEAPRLESGEACAALGTRTRSARRRSTARRPSSRGWRRGRSTRRSRARRTCTGRCRSARRTGRRQSSVPGATIFSQYMRAGSTPSGSVGRDPHGVVVDGLGAGQRAVEAGVVGLRLGSMRRDHAVDGGDHGVGRERRAVVERDVVAERELPRRVVDLRRQVGGQTRSARRRRRASAASRRCCR